jgi:hypothetical protein
VDKGKLAGLAVRTAARHPKPTVKGAKFVVAHRKGILETVRVAKKTQRTAPPIVAQLGSREVQREVAAAIGALRAALHRSSKLGAGKTLKDKRVARLVGEAGSHLAAAMQVEPQRKRHRMRKVVLGVVVGGAVAAVTGRYLSSSA